MDEVYKPREDSYILAKHVENNVFGHVLDMGTGSGIQAVVAAKKPEVVKVVAVDLNPRALDAAKVLAVNEGVYNKIEFICSDLFENVEDRFDCVRDCLDRALDGVTNAIPPALLLLRLLQLSFLLGGLVLFFLLLLCRPLFAIFEVIVGFLLLFLDQLL